MKHFCIGWDVAILHDWWRANGKEMRGILAAERSQDTNPGRDQTEEASGIAGGPALPVAGHDPCATDHLVATRSIGEA